MMTNKANNKNGNEIPKVQRQTQIVKKILIPETTRKTIGKIV